MTSDEMAFEPRDVINHWTYTFLGILTSPRATMRQLSRSPDGVPAAVTTLVLVAIVDGLASAGHSWWVPLIVVGDIIGTVAGWLALAGGIALLATVFHVEGQRMRASFVTTAWGQSFSNSFSIF